MRTVLRTAEYSERLCAAYLVKSVDRYGHCASKSKTFLFFSLHPDCQFTIRSRPLHRTAGCTLHCQRLAGIDSKDESGDQGVDDENWNKQWTIFRNLPGNSSKVSDGWVITGCQCQMRSVGMWHERRGMIDMIINIVGRDCTGNGNGFFVLNWRLWN